jgi:hypothetical protein
MLKLTENYYYASFSQYWHTRICHLKYYLISKHKHPKQIDTKDIQMEKIVPVSAHTLGSQI